MISKKANNTKKDLRISRLLLSVAAVASIVASSPAALANSTDGVPSANTEVQQDVAAQGRAYLTIEDLKTLLGMTARDPSAVESQSNKEASTGSYAYILSLSAGEKKALAAKIHKVEAERAQLAAKIEREVKAQKSEMKQKRKSLQVARMGAGSKSDEALSRSLFESILQESNVETRMAQELESFDNSHLVNIEFSASNDSRAVQTIAIGETTIWNLGGAQRLAKK